MKSERHNWYLSTEQATSSAGVSPRCLKCGLRKSTTKRLGDGSFAPCERKAKRERREAARC